MTLFTFTITIHQFEANERLILHYTYTIFTLVKLLRDNNVQFIQHGTDVVLGYGRAKSLGVEPITD